MRFLQRLFLLCLAVFTASVSAFTGNTPAYTHNNSRGDIVAKTNSAGTITYQAQYEGFGTRVKEIGNTADRQKANSKDEDPTGLLNEGIRIRDLDAAVFITPDPLGFVDGPNRYRKSKGVKRKI